MPSDDHLLQSISRYFHTIRHLKPVQVLYRLWYLLEDWCQHTDQRRVSSKPSFHRDTDDQAVRSELLKSRCSVERSLEIADQILAGQFSFLNQTEQVTIGQVDWKRQGKAQLWRFHLHYFQYAVHLGMAYRKTGDSRYFQVFRQLVLDWIRSNDRFSGDGWHPYTISRRVPNWIMADLLFTDEWPGDVQERQFLYQSLAVQTGYLHRHLEYDLQANHLLANARALLIAGRYFDNDHWYTSGRKLLENQLQEQGLSDGGHFEASPMYHCLVLRDVLDCILFAREEGRFQSQMKEHAGKMLHFLKNIQYADGTVPLMQDTVLDQTPDPKELLQYAEALQVEEVPEQTLENQRGLTEFPETGYARFHRERETLIMDTGGTGRPSYQPGHLHAGMLGFEYVAGHQKIFVDSGTGIYQDRALREECRGTSAHNTVMIDGTEQSDIWELFRLGRRAEVTDQTRDQFTKAVGRTWTLRPGLQRYLRHTRSLVWSQEDFWLMMDFVTSDESDQEVHQVDSFLHLHPDLSYRKEENEVYSIRGLDDPLSIIPVGCEVREETGKYCPEFGVVEEKEVQVFSCQRACPVVMGYVVSRGEVEKEEVQWLDEGNCVGLEVRDHSFVWAVDEDGVRTTESQSTQRQK